MINSPLQFKMIKVNLKRIEPPAVPVALDLDTTVESLNSTAQCIFSTDIKYQKLFHSSEFLNDPTRTLRSLGVENGDDILVMHALVCTASYYNIVNCIVKGGCKQRYFSQQTGTKRISTCYSAVISAGSLQVRSETS